MKSIANKIKEGIIGLSLLGLVSNAGCGDSNVSKNDDFAGLPVRRNGSDTYLFLEDVDTSSFDFIDRESLYTLFSKNNDLYVVSRSSNEIRRITHTPKVKKWGCFNYYGSLIIYQEKQKGRGIQYFVLPVDKDDSSKREISENEYLYLKDPYLH